MMLQRLRSWLSNNSLVLLLIVIIVCLFGISCYRAVNQPQVIPNNPIKNLVDTFYITRDSIIERIDTLTVEKVKHEIVYKELESKIDTQSVSADYEFFTEYLRTRFPSDYNNDSIKASK